MNTTLLIMAAGLGSRYGGNKQIDRIGPNGEILMEYSIHDAVEAGFDKVVFVIRKSMDELFRSMIGDKIAKKVKVEYAYQEYDSLPDGFVPPADRTKPYGTVHAVACAKDVIHEPMAPCTRLPVPRMLSMSHSLSSMPMTIMAVMPSRPWRMPFTACGRKKTKPTWSLTT